MLELKNQNEHSLILLSSLQPSQSQARSTHKVKLVSVAPELNDYGKFQKGTLVTTKKPTFGIVSKVIANSYTPIQISWWQSNSEEVDEKFDYSFDALQALKIEPLPLFIPQKTFLTIPSGTLVLTQDNEWVQWTETLFWLKGIDEAGYHLVNQNESWLFPHLNFPGIPFACVNELVSQAALEASCYLSETDIKIKAGLWLSQNSPLNILERLLEYPKIQSDLFEQFSKSKYLQEEKYNDKNLSAGWGDAFLEHLNERKRTVGLFNFKEKYRVAQFATENENISHLYNWQFGTVINIEPSAERPIVIQWEQSLGWQEEWEQEESTTSYSKYEIHDNLITLILPVVKLSETVGYEISADGRFYRAFVGFSAKAIGKSWWKEIKKELGRISDLLPNYDPQVQHLTNEIDAKYFYLAAYPREKGLPARLRHLQEVAKLDLSKKKESWS
ncbi:hypothetical protein [Crinalium epipsammum]|nr:hypothetical protein [Crinalium epipsammum]